MLRTLIHLWVCSIILFNGMVHSVICVNFQINRDVLSRYFCEQRSEPMSTCQGSCILKRQLDLADHQEEETFRFRLDFGTYYPPAGADEVRRTDARTAVLTYPQPINSYLKSYFIGFLDQPPEL